jgi:hypothetical protein
MRNLVARRRGKLAALRTGLASMEHVEGRRLMSVTTWTSSSISEPSGAYFGQVLMGDNGNVYGTPTVVVGAGGEALASTYLTWDSNLDDGMDSGWVNAWFVDAAGQVDMGSGNVGEASFQPSSELSIHQVVIRSVVESTYMSMSWRDLTVNFFIGGEVVETVTVGDLTADTLAGNSNDPQEAIALVTGSAAGYDGVTVTGQVRLTVVEGTYAGPGDIFGQVLIS